MRLPIFLVLTCISFVVFGQKSISISDFTSKNTFRQNSVRGINWMNDGNYYSALAGNKIEKYETTSGKLKETIVDGDNLQNGLRIAGYEFSNDESKLLLLTNRQRIYRRSYTAEYYVYEIATKKLISLSPNGPQSYATFSSDGSKVAFTRNNDLFYVDLKANQEVRVTTTGKPQHIINGSTDWVYEEELSLTKAFSWSPDGKVLAYYTFDESHVKEYNMQVWGDNQLYATDYRYKYPKAGERNSIVKLTFYDLATQKQTPIDIGNEKDIYIPRIKWTTNPGILSVIRLNRLQNKMEILHANTATGKTNIILTQNYPTYVDIDEADDLTYLKDGKHFIITGEQSGYRHIYLYDITGKLIRQITKGDWEVKQFMGIDENSKGKTLYYSSTEVSPKERHVYQLNLNGKKKLKITDEPGMHSINMSNDFGYYIHSHHNARQPTTVSLFKTKGHKAVKVIAENKALLKVAESYQLANKEFFTFPAKDGTTLHGYMLKPKNFDPDKKYPVLIYQYSGPGSQNVTNSWGGGHFFWHQMLTQKGYLIAVVDPRGTGSRGTAFQKITYKQLGKYEVEDHIEAAKYLGDQSYIDKSRIGIWGWSYGGYISSLTLFKGGDYFKTAIAVAPVTSWRYYDTIYTERYLQKPQDNGPGYDDNSPITHAGKLKGNFLLVHGTGDDNVHFQNAVFLQNALIDAGKQFDSFYYPDRAHGIRKGKQTRVHLYKMMTNYILDNL